MRYLTHQSTEGISKLDESCTSNPKSEILNWTSNPVGSRTASAVQSYISDFGFEVQDSSNFEISWLALLKRRGLLLALLFIGLTQPMLALQSDSAVKLPPFSKFQLPNGMTVLLMEQHEVPIVSFNFIVKAGSVADPPGKDGVAAISAGLLRKGTRTRTSDQIASELDFIGGQFDMSAALDFTAGSAEFLKKDLSKGLDLLSDVLRNPTFPADETRKLTAQQIDGIKSAKDRVANVINRYFNSYLFGAHPYGRSGGGTETSLANISRDDVVRFYETYYTPSNFILAAAGDFNTADMRKTLEERFSGWAAKAVPTAELSVPSPSPGRRLLLVDKPDATQTYFYIGNLGISRTNADRVAVTVVNTLFGGRFTSRLNTALRVDTGLTYGANSQFDQRRLPGTFAISSYTRNTDTEKALDMALEVLDALHTKGITETELQSVKAYLKGQFPPTLETTDRLASTLTRQEFYGLDENDVNSYVARVEAVTLAEAGRVIKQYFPRENLAFVLIGKASEIEPIAKKYAPQIDVKTISEPGF